MRDIITKRSAPPRIEIRDVLGSPLLLASSPLATRRTCSNSRVPTSEMLSVPSITFPAEMSRSCDIFSNTRLFDASFMTGCDRVAYRRSVSGRKNDHRRPDADKARRRFLVVAGTLHQVDPAHPRGFRILDAVLDPRRPSLYDRTKRFDRDVQQGRPPCCRYSDFGLARLRISKRIPYTSRPSRRSSGLSRRLSHRLARICSAPQNSGTSVSSTVP